MWRKRLHACVRASGGHFEHACNSRTISINAANYCYHLIVKIYRLTRYLFQTNASFFDINVSQGSVATRLKCGGIFHNDFIANLPLTLQLKVFRKSVSIWWSYGKKYSGMFFFDSQCISNTYYVLSDTCIVDVILPNNITVKTTEAMTFKIIFTHIITK